ncbi:MAG TPA: phospholipase D-like domain-containing protein [Bacteroidota bacterium]
MPFKFFSLRLPVLFFLIVRYSSPVFAQGLDIAGWKVIQANAAATFVIPLGTTIPEGGYVLAVRNADKAAFESFWGVALGQNVVYLNTSDASGVAPKINGSETFELQNAASQNQDGPTVAMPSSPGGRTVFQRTSATDAAGTAESWISGSTFSPGTGMTSANTGTVIISEFADTTGTGNFNYEYVELYYDLTPPETGDGSAYLLPNRWKFDAATTLEFILTSQTDTLRGFSIVKPDLLSWSAGDVSTSDPGTVLEDGDTLRITGFVLPPGDSLGVSIANVTSVDTTEELSFSIKSSTDTVTFLPLASQPKTLVYSSPRPIIVVKQKDGSGVHVFLGKWAVTQGIVTVANEFGGPSYLQDGTAAMALFDSSVSNNIERGDEIVILGLVAPFNDLFEFAPGILLEKLSEANEVDTLVVTAAQITGQTVSEPYESRLIRINNVTVNTSTWGSTSGSGTNYNLTDITGTVQTRISSRVNFAGQPAPSGVFDMVGVLGQFFSNYQILPRTFDDIIVSGAGPAITSAAPYETDLASTQVTLSWTTNTPGTSIVNYGLTPSHGSQVVDTAKVTMHQVTLTGLSAATIYQFQIGSADSAGTTLSANHVFSTSSQSSTGAINIYFNQSIDLSVAVAETAMANVNLVSKLVERIDAAQYSIDVCLYSLSGTAGATVATALVNAKDRGIKVRVIGEMDNQGTAPWTTLKNNGITVIDDGYDAVNAGAGLMHNKFFVFDYRGGEEDSTWVMTGSWNVTDPGSNNDMQNVIRIQDKALAGAYTVEFQEMWGSTTDTPSAPASRFGARKIDNTPHRFVIGGVAIESYFSPSDRTTSRIIATVEGAVHSVNIALLTFTRSDIANALKDLHDAGVQVRGLLDNSSDTGSQFNFLVNNGMDFLIDVNSAFLHHKYAVVDAEAGKSLPNYVITGSHNWSSSAENSNNENTLIIEDHRIANLYLQEFKARYVESGGSATIVVNVGEETAVPESFGVSRNYPNPFNGITNFELRVANWTHVELRVYDVLGREVSTILSEPIAPGLYSVQWNSEKNPSGVYFLRLTAGSFVETKKMLLIR